MHDEARDPLTGQQREPAVEVHLGAQAALGAVVDVAGDDEEGGPALEGELDDRVERLQRRLPQGIGDERREVVDVAERRVEVQIGRVDKAERRPGAVGHHGEATDWLPHPPTVAAGEATPLPVRSVDGSRRRSRCTSGQMYESWKVTGGTPSAASK